MELHMWRTFFRWLILPACNVFTSFPSFPFLKMAESKGRNSGKQGNFTVCLLFGKYQIKQLPTPRNAEGKKTRAMSERLG